MKRTSSLLGWISFVLVFTNCNNNKKEPVAIDISSLQLKRGQLVSCGPADKQFGTVDLLTSCSPASKKDFSLALALLHSFEYDEAEKVFAKVIDEDPDCAMAYWGVAMSNFHALWAPPNEEELKKGAKAVAIAMALPRKSERELQYIEAIGAYFSGYETRPHGERTIAFEKAMEKVFTKYPGDKEAAAFYALALDASASPNDKTYANQLKAGSILGNLYPNEPNHPGIVHYIIHTYDYPGLAERALPAARKYASVAPSSAHALHMPTHIFTRLGLWEESIRSNKVSVEAAQCYAASAGLKGHWDEELHGLDYLVYGFLQRGQVDSAKSLLKYLHSIQQVDPFNFKVAYAFASIPSRIFLETRDWKAAASIQPHIQNIDWKKYPWQEAILHYTRAMGLIHLGKMKEANFQIDTLIALAQTLTGQKDPYKARQVEVQVRTCQAWAKFENGDKEQGLKMMRLAADIEDSTEKHPVTPGEVLPARELLGDMLMADQQSGKALEAYETSFLRSPNRFNGLSGAALAARKAKQDDKAMTYYQKLVSICASNGTARQKLKDAIAYLDAHK